MYFFSNSPVKWRLTKVVCLLAISVFLDNLKQEVAHLACNVSPPSVISSFPTMRLPLPPHRHRKNQTHPVHQLNFLSLNHFTTFSLFFPLPMSAAVEISLTVPPSPHRTILKVAWFSAILDVLSVYLIVCVEDSFIDGKVETALLACAVCFG